VEINDIKCVGCGLCCKVFNFAHDPKAPKHIDEFLGELTIVPIGYGRCNHLGDDNRCKIYDTRPKMCREFNCWEHDLRVAYGCSFNQLIYENAVRLGISPVELINKIVNEKGDKDATSTKC